MLINKDFMFGKIKKILRPLYRIFRNWFQGINKRLARYKSGDLPELVYKMALTGSQTDECLEIGALPMLVHFYSPVPDIPDLKSRDIFNKRSKLTGIDFREKAQIEFLLTIGKEYGLECEWPKDQTDNEEEFFLNNGCFSYGCAASLHGMIRHFKPKSVIEVGSGYSSRIISAAVGNNIGEGYQCNYKIIDPYPNEVTKRKLCNLNELKKERVELIDETYFSNLKENDILFIDSGHTARIGSDVNFLFLDVLPALEKGVVVHIHDINLPYEYPEVYYTNPAFRVFWTEAYLLQAFLSFNSAFQILLALNYIQTDHQNEFCKAFPKFNPQDNWANSGSFWIQKMK